MEYVLYFISFALILAGIVGSILPILPGPPLSWLGILCFSFTEINHFSLSFLIWTGIVAGLITILDYIIPIWGTKKFGGTKAGVRGSTIGLVIGIVFMPFGMISILVGPMLGAFIGEMTVETNTTKALKSAFGSLLGFVVGSGLKLMYGFYVAYKLLASVI